MMVKIPATMRPGVFTQTSIRPVSSTGLTHAGIACAAQAAGGVPAEVRKISALPQAVVFGTDSALYGMVSVLLGAGASPVYAVPANGGYETALAACEELSDISVVVSDGGAAALAAHVSACGGQGRERIGIAAVSDPETACQTAKNVNHAHIVVACDGGSKTAVTAAAFAAVVAAAGAQESLNGAPIPFGAGFDGSLSSAEIQTLLQSGVTPFELCGDEVECVRAVTSCTSVEGVADRTFSSLSTTLAVDNVVASVRRAVKSRLKGLKNNAATRESIASQITVELEAKRALGVIDSYRAPLVSIHPQDPGICVATLALRVAPEISQIVISTEIQV